MLTALTSRTGLFTAARISDKQQQLDYAATTLYSFILEVGRAEAILQSGNETYLKSLLHHQQIAQHLISILTIIQLSEPRGKGYTLRCLDKFIPYDSASSKSTTRYCS